MEMDRNVKNKMERKMKIFKEERGKITFRNL
jgi:hypothetical protein